MKKERLLIFDLKSLTHQINRYIQHNKTHDKDDVLTGVQHGVLGFICRSHEKKDIFQKDIEEEFKIRRSTATGILQKMEKNGYIKREPVGHDARLKKIVLLPKAVALHEGIIKDLVRLDNEITSNLSPQETEQLYYLIDKLKENLKQEA